MSYPNLGSMIREKRSDRGMTQSDVCKVLEWKELYRISDIEQGNKTLDLDTLKKLFVILGFTPEDQGLALYFSGVPPTEEEGKKWVERLTEYVDEREYATYLHDFTWRIYYANRKARDIFLLDDGVFQRRENLLELVLNPENPTYDRVHHQALDFEAFLEGQVASFREEHLHRTNEPWFRELLAKLMRHDEFAKIWTELEQASLLHLRRVMMVRGANTIMLPRIKKGATGATTELRAYTIFSGPVVGDERFRIKQLVPARIEIDDVDDATANRDAIDDHPSKTVEPPRAVATR